MRGRPEGLSRTVEVIAAALVGAERADTVLGDLVEEFAAVRDRSDRWRATVWFLWQACVVGAQVRLAHWRGPGWVADVRVATRRLMREPGFSSVAVIALAFAVAANGVVLTVAQTVLFGSLPYPAWDRLGVLTSDHVGSETGGFGVSLLSMRDVSEGAGPIERVSLYMDWQDVTLATGDEAFRVPAAFVDDAYFELLGLDVSLGRPMVAEENRATDARPVAVLGHGFWRTVLGGAPDVIGRTLTVNGRSWEVVGVLADDRGDLRYRWGQDAAGIFLPLRAADILTPFDLDSSRGLRVLNALVRLQPGATMESAQAELSRISEELAVAHAATHEGWTYRIEALDEAFFRAFRAPARVLIVASLCVLLLVAVNLTTLVLIRSTGRGGEWQVRRALGAARPVLFRQFATEYLLLTVTGAAAGVLLASWLLGVIDGTGVLRLPTYASTRLEGRTVAASFAIAVGLAALFSVLTLLTLAGRERAGTSTRVSAGRGTVRTQAVLVAAEVALALALLVGAGWMLQSLRALEGTGYGFETERLVLARVDLQGERYGADVLRAESEALIERASRIPGVEAALVWSPNRLGHGNDVDLLTVENRWQDHPGERIEASMHLLHPGTLGKLGIPLLRGRDVGPADRDGSPRVALISRDLAQALWPGEDALGRRMETMENGRMVSITVIGVVGNARHRTRLIDPFGPQRDIYHPFAQNPARTWTLALRHADGADVAAVTRAARAAITGIDPLLPVYDITTMAELVRQEESGSRLATLLIALYALLALALATMGLYGVLSYWVAQRRREIGIRLAVGADRRAILRAVVQGGLPAIGAGIGLGLLGALAAARGARAALYGVNPLHPVTFAAAALVLAACALLACVRPAWNASRLEPASVLKD